VRESDAGYCPLCQRSYGPELDRCPAHGFLFQSKDALRRGTVVDGTYEILQRLGAGGMGETYLVRHVFMGEQLVLKRVRPELAEDSVYQKLFLREAQSLAALRNEAGVVGIRHACQTREGYLILLLEYIQGGNLLQWLETERGGGPLEVAEAMVITGELAETLAAAHEHGILHRDVKPSNVLMYPREDDRFQTKLCDFGLAVQRMEEMGRQGTTTTRFGTPGYAAPEQYTLPSREQDARVDMFGLGMTLYWLLAGRLPWDATFANWPLVCTQQRRRTLQQLQPALWREMSLDRFLERMTAVDRDERIATADEALAIIREGYSEAMSGRTAAGAPPVVDRPGLSGAEIAWLIAWNIATGEWSRVDLDEEQGRTFLHNLLRNLSGDLLSAAEEAWMVLQRCLMALRREGFEDIQQEAPFSRYALSNMLALARAWMEGGETGLLRKWADVFAPGWEAKRPRQEPVQIIVDTGDSEEHALEVRGAPDRKTRISAEYWYLFYTFGKSWKHGGHSTRKGRRSGTLFSVHNIRMFPNFRQTVIFRIPA